VPDDFVVRGLESDADLPGRVEAHRAAFAPSKMTEESYRQVQATDIYRRDLDVIAVSPEGRIAAFCLAWLDESSGTGLFEPVATHPDFQRQGLGRVVCLEAAHRLRDLGAHTAFITSWASNDGANRLYSSLGAEIHTHFRPYRRSLSAPAAAA
jgi:ribosomal protein S18 acetylase RimI-like enzyme